MDLTYLLIFSLKLKAKKRSLEDSLDDSHSSPSTDSLSAAVHGHFSDLVSGVAPPAPPGLMRSPSMPLMRSPSFPGSGGFPGGSREETQDGGDSEGAVVPFPSVLERMASMDSEASHASEDSIM